MLQRPFIVAQNYIFIQIGVQKKIKMSFLRFKVLKKNAFGLLFKKSSHLFSKFKISIGIH